MGNDLSSVFLVPHKWCGAGAVNVAPLPSGPVVHPGQGSSRNDFISARSTCLQHQHCSLACTCAQGAKESRKLSQNSGNSPQKVLKYLMVSVEHKILFLHCNDKTYRKISLLEKTELCSWRRDCKNYVIMYVWKQSKWSQHHIPPGFIQLLPAWVRWLP